MSSSDTEIASAIDTHAENLTVDLERHITSTIVMGGAALAAFTLVVRNISVTLLWSNWRNSVQGCVLLLGALGIVIGNHPLPIVGVLTTTDSDNGHHVRSIRS